MAVLGPAGWDNLPPGPKLHSIFTSMPSGATMVSNSIEMVDNYWSSGQTRIYTYEPPAPIQVGDRVFVGIDSMDVEIYGLKEKEPGEVLEIKDDKYLIKTEQFYDWFSEKEITRC